MEMVGGRYVCFSACAQQARTCGVKQNGKKSQFKDLSGGKFCGPPRDPKFRFLAQYMYFYFWSCIAETSVARGDPFGVIPLPPSHHALWNLRTPPPRDSKFQFCGLFTYVYRKFLLTDPWHPILFSISATQHYIL